MTFYQELQLNQAGSKALIRHSATKKEKLRHTAVYMFKVALTLGFCMAFVLFYSKIFGADNSITGVVVLLAVMVFRQADLGIHAKHGVPVMLFLFAVMAFGPHLANVAGPFPGFFIHAACIFLLMVLGCHNVIMSNHSTFVLGYLLLFGYDVSGKAYFLRVAGMAVGAVFTGIIYWRNHRKRTYKRTVLQVFKEFRLFSARSRWQLLITLGVSSSILLAQLLSLPRPMWVGIAAMSVLLPFQNDLSYRVRRRIPGNIMGGFLFVGLYIILPPSFVPFLGILGGIGVGFSATYIWQSAFNSLGAISIAAGLLGFPQAVFFRVLNNMLGAVYGFIFHQALNKTMNYFQNRIETGQQAA